MKKVILFGGLVILAFLVLGIAGFAYAQAQTPTPPFPGGGMGQWMMDRRNGYRPGMMTGRRGGGMMGGAYGPLHPYVVNALAEALNLKREDIQSRLEAGETMWQIAQSQELRDEQVLEVMQSAHEAALQAAVAAGVITQEQADWMNEHMQQRGENGAGFGGCHGGRARPGGRWNNQPAAPTN